MSEIVYLDICCFKRSFDDAAQERVRREAEAVATLLDAAQSGRILLVRSPAHDYENERNPREDRRLATLLWLQAASVHPPASGEAFTRARELVTLGFAPLDAMHLAFAEQSEAIWFVTTDDQLLKRAAAYQERLRVRVILPDQFPLATEGGKE
jgi:hypothetical protein